MMTVKTEMSIGDMFLSYTWAMASHLVPFCTKFPSNTEQTTLSWFYFLVISEISFFFWSSNFIKDDKQLVQPSFSCFAGAAFTKVIKHWFYFSLWGKKMLSTVKPLLQSSVYAVHMHVLVSREVNMQTN